MIPGHPQICLYQPEIPQNTGNIGRLAAGSGSRLHLTTPLGFSTDDKNLKRSGLDYWPFLDLEIHDDFEKFLTGFSKVAFLSKKATKSYTEMPTDTQLLVFGRETSGLPDHLSEQYPNDFYSIPIFHSGVRSYNLANSVSMVLFELIRKKGLS